MGWTFLHRDKGAVSDREFFEREFRPYPILDMSKTGFTLYFMMEDPKTKDRFAFVVMTRWRRNDWYNFGFKEIEETCGPIDHDCPDRILDRLTPTDSKWANEWREKCRERNKGKVRLEKGAIVETKEPIIFRGGGQCQRFVVLDAKRRIFKDANDKGDYPYWKCRLSRYALQDATVTYV